MNMKKTRIVIIVSALVACMGIGTISAYFTDADTSTNTFTVGKVGIDLKEPNWVLQPGILPKDELPKDPQVTNTGVNDAYVFMEVVVPYANVTTENDDGTRNEAKDTELFSYDLKKEWVEVNTANKDTENETVTRLYGYGTEDKMTVVPSGVTTEPVFDYVRFANVVEDEGLEETIQEVTVKAYAIQTDNINGGTEKPDEVWEVIKNQTPKEEKEESEINYADFIITSGNRTMVGYTGAENEELVIPKTFYDETSNTWYKVIGIDEHAFNDCTSLSKITIPDSVTFIGYCAFYNCTSLTEITIPESVTSIGGEAFMKCTNLAKIALPSSVTSINEQTFNSCINLTEITIPESVTSIGEHAFNNCQSLTEITIPSRVTSIGNYAFYDCTNLAEITIPSSVTSIGDYAFYNCQSLTEITIPEGVTSIGNRAFMTCNNLTKITIPSSVTSIGSYAFSSCSSLAEITIPEGVTSIGKHTFSSCSSLTEITIPEGVTSIGDYAFSTCSNLAKITIPSSVTSIGEYAFKECKSLTEITLPEGVTSIGKRAFYGCSKITEIIIPSSMTSIGDSAFRNCNRISKVNYTGTEEQWNQISIGSENTYLTGATITYNYK